MTRIEPRTAGRTGDAGADAPDAVRLDHVSLAYGDVLALDDVTIRVPAGSAVALVGANGAGKSSLLAVIAGLVRPTSGAVGVEGRPVERGNGSSASLGLLTHRTMLYDGLTGRENLTLHARLRGLPVTHVDTVLEQADLTAVADRLAGSCSHGARKRLALARALLHDPRLLLLDEPFAGLDPDAQERLSGLLEQIRGDKTVLFSTHDLGRTVVHADRVLRLDRGRVVADTPQLVSQGHPASPATRSAKAGEPTPHPAGVLHAARAMLRKDLTVEARTRSASTAVLVLAGLLATVLAMAFEPLAGSPRAVSGILWVLVVFTALHGLARSFDDDFRDDALRGLLLTGADPAGVYLGRVASTAAFLLAVSLAAVAGIAVLFTTPSLLQVLPGLVVVVVLAVVGLAAMGGVLTVLSRHSRLGETLLPLLFLPLAVPVLLAGVESVAILLETGVTDTGWLRVLAFYAVGMLAASSVLFEHAVEG
jgi:heme exporter protein A